MRRRKLKPAVKIIMLSTISLAVLLVLLVSVNSKTKSVVKQTDDFVYVNDYIFDNYYPVIKNDELINKPYSSDKVTVEKNFYEKDESDEVQQKSIVYYDGIYMQNSGVDYESNEEFDVVSSFTGTVTNISNDTLLGKTIEIKSNDKITAMYQCVDEVLVKKGDNIIQGQVLAKSGTCPLNNNSKYNLHFELYKNGNVINPEKYIGKSIKELIK